MSDLLGQVLYTTVDNIDNAGRRPREEKEMTEYPMLFRTTIEDIFIIKDRILNAPDLVNDYYAKYGGAWQLTLSGDIIAVAVEWCYRDYMDSFEFEPTLDEFEEAFDEYDYWELFSRLGLDEISPGAGLARPIMRTYAMVILEGE